MKLPDVGRFRGALEPYLWVSYNTMDMTYLFLLYNQLLGLDYIWVSIIKVLKSRIYENITVVKNINKYNQIYYDR